jgi:hypothetical protein
MCDVWLMEGMRRGCWACGPKRTIIGDWGGYGLKRRKRTESLSEATGFDAFVPSKRDMAATRDGCDDS